MKVLLSNFEGLEEFTIKEIEFLKENDKIDFDYSVNNLKNSLVEIELKKIEHVISLVYQLKTIGRAGILIKKFDFEDILKLKKEIEVSIEEIIQKLEENNLPHNSFSLRITNKSEKELNKLLLQNEFGKIINKKIKKVNLEQPECLLRLIFTREEVFLIYDLIGEKDLSKREYKIFNHPNSLNCVLAHNLLYFSNSNHKEKILDPMAGVGTICIELAWKELFIPNSYLREDLLLFKLEKAKKIIEKINNQIEWNKKLNIFCFDKNIKNVEYSRKNARIAKVEDKINFSRVSVDWLDWKFDENEIDKIITHPPNDTKTIKELFYQGEFIGKDIYLVTNLNLKEIEKYSKEYNLEIKETKEIKEIKEIKEKEIK